MKLAVLIVDISFPVLTALNLQLAERSPERTAGSRVQPRWSSDDRSSCRTGSVNQVLIKCQIRLVADLTVVQNISSPTLDRGYSVPHSLRLTTV
jgi:hypothetical protein